MNMNLKNHTKVLPEADLLRTYDKVPVKALSQEIISNRVVYGNFQDKHTPPASLNYNLGVSAKENFSLGLGTAQVDTAGYSSGVTTIPYKRCYISRIFKQRSHYNRTRYSKQYSYCFF